MRIQELPFLHYMMIAGAGRESHLLSPMESEDVGAGGTFVAPLRDGGSFYSAYRFQFSIYLGAGSFVEECGQKALFHGVAVTIKRKRQDHLLLVPDLTESYWSRLPREKESCRPFLRRTPRRPPLKYGGRLVHGDFQRTFVQLEPADPDILDELFDRFKISIVGCDVRHRRGE